MPDTKTLSLPASTLAGGFPGPPPALAQALRARTAHGLGGGASIKARAHRRPDRAVFVGDVLARGKPRQRRVVQS